MNPYVILGVVVLWGGSVGGAFWYGTGVGENKVIAKQAKDNELVLETRKAAQLGAADAIAQIKITNTTVRGKVETIIRDNPVYRDVTCRHDAIGMQYINEALTGRSVPADRGVVPGTDAHE